MLSSSSSFSSWIAVEGDVDLRATLACDRDDSPSTRSYETLTSRCPRAHDELSKSSSANGLHQRVARQRSLRRI